MGALIARASVLYKDDTVELVQLLNCPMYATLYVIGSWPLFMVYCIWHFSFCRELGSRRLLSIFCSHSGAGLHLLLLLYYVVHFIVCIL